MIDTIIGILTTIRDIYLSMVDGLNTFVNTLIGVEADIDALSSIGSGNTVHAFIGHFRYLVGDPIYLGFWVVIFIGSNMLLFNLGRIVVKAFDSGLATKVKFRFK